MKRVLIISYYWPPAGGIGVHRCLKFAKYLREFSWEPLVYAPANAQYPYLDPENERDIPEGMTVIRRPIREPFKAYHLITGKKGESAVTGNPLQVRSGKMTAVDKLSIWIRGNLFIPDARAMWIRPSVKFLTNYLKDQPVDAILSDGPPHTNTVIACRLSKNTGIPWLADFQDPWTQIDYHGLLKLTGFARKRHIKLEQEAFRVSRKITIASPTWKNDLESIGAQNVDVVFWGYDEDDFIEISPSSDTKRDFIISHAGLLGYDRHPEKLLKTLRKMVEDDPGFGKHLKIKLAGSVDYSVKEDIKNNGLLSHTEFLGQIMRKDVLRLNAESHILLLPLNKAQNAKGRIPGKLFEYLRAKVPILALGPLGSDVEKILKETRHGSSFQYDDQTGPESYIKELYGRFLKNQELLKETSDITKYNVRNQTAKIAHFLNEIAAT